MLADLIPSPSTTVAYPAKALYRTRTEKIDKISQEMSTQERIAAWCMRLRASDHDAFEAVFREMHDSLLNYALFLTKSRPVALDITQETFIKLWEKRETLNPERSLKALLYMIVRNLSYNHRRDSLSREAKLSDPTAYSPPVLPGPEEDLNAGLLQDKMQQWIDELPDRQREALTLSRLQGLSHEEIASVMEVSPRTVNNHIVRALKYLHGQVTGYEPSLLQS